MILLGSRRPGPRPARPAILGATGIPDKHQELGVLVTMPGKEIRKSRTYLLPHSEYLRLHASDNVGTVATIDEP
jgi:hypothetical protein